MIESSARGPRRGSTSCEFPLLFALVLGLAISAAPPARAEQPEAGGQPTLLSRWSLAAPALDGVISPGEWDPVFVPIDAQSRLYLMNDARTLYLAVVIDGEAGLEAGDALTLAFDDQGGATPLLWDGQWALPSCGGINQGEGLLVFEPLPVPGRVRFLPRIAGGGQCPPQEGNSGAAFVAAASLQGVTYEVALPLDGRSPVVAKASEEFGFALAIDDGATGGERLWPSTLVRESPATFGNLRLTGFGCNGPFEGFSLGPPLTWFPLVVPASGPAWAPSGAGGYPANCGEANYTGGAGLAACASSANAVAGDFESLLFAPALSLAGTSGARLRLRANYQDIASGVDLLVLEGRGVSNPVWTPLLSWDEDHGALRVVGGEAVEVDLAALVALGEPVQLRWRYAGSGLGPGRAEYAQIDDVGVLCEPRLFVDGFESALTTHWSSQLP